MSSIASSEVVVPHKLTATERGKLIDELYLVHSQIFDGVEKDVFAKYVVESKAQQTALHLHKNSAGAVVGYSAVHVFEKQLRGRPVAVFRAEAGSLREYRGNSANLRIGAAFVLRYLLAHPLRPLFYLGTLVHPSSYLFFANNAGLLWPNEQQPLAPEVAAFMADLADTFGLRAVDAGNPLVVHVGWRTRDTEVERDYWRGCDKPAARFFVQQNAHYSEGHGLMTLVPIDRHSLLHLAARLCASAAQGPAGRVRALAYRLPIAGAYLSAHDIQRRLKRTRLFANVSDADIAAVARTAELLTLPAGRSILEEGDAGGDAFVIVSGSVFALQQRDGAARVIDQLLAGELFGEIAMLSGEPRSASIRTATKTMLIRLKRQALLALMDTHPQMRDAIWDAFAMRRFDITAGRSNRFSALSRQQRREWLARGRQEHCAAGVRTTIEGPWLFVLSGAVELQQRGAWSTLAAPALIEVTEPLELVAQLPSRLIQLPALVASGAEG